MAQGGNADLERERGMGYAVVRNAAQTPAGGIKQQKGCRVAQKSGQGGRAQWWGRFLLRGALVLFILFDAAALHYSTIEPPALLATLTWVYVLIAGAALILLPFRRSMVAGWLVSFAVLAWYVHDKPSNDRDWAVEYAIPAAVAVDGNTVSFTNIRDFSYRSETDPIPHYYNASFKLDQLSSVDLVSSYWSGDAISHLFLTFGFQDGRHIAFSIETRRQKRFPYSVIAGFFHHYELFYVAADERDLLGVRTDVRHERVYLYNLTIPPQRREALFLSYVRKIQDLAVHPQWYNTLTDNCTTGILARAKDPAPVRLNRHLVLSGYVPEYAYSLGLLDTDVSFAALQKGSRIVRPAGAQIGADYSQAIRAGLPYYPRP